LKIILTVSPVRHWKDGAHGNQLSKAILLLAVERLCEQFKDICYFPAYELVMDELRDYRFYAEDMVHPSNVAVEYIWQRFVETYMTAETQAEMHVLQQLWRDRHHRFLHPESEEAKRFEQRTAEKIQKLQRQYPWLM
jgi:hypothetical protein